MMLRTKDNDTSIKKILSIAVTYYILFEHIQANGSKNDALSYVLIA